MSRRATDSFDDWIRLLEPEGPFFTAAVLRQAFPSGLDRLDSALRAEVKERWANSSEAGDRSEWIDWLLRTGLGWGDRYVTGEQIPAGLVHDAAEHDTVIRPTGVLVARHPGATDAVPRVLVLQIPPTAHPSRRMPGESWSATPVQRAALLCRSVNCPLALVTDGDLLTVVRAPRDQATGHGTWRASIFTSEGDTLHAFTSLFNLRRFQALGADDTPERLLDRSAANQSEITDTLGRQAREAIEVLVNAISRGNLHQGGELLDGVTPHDVYEAAVTVLMRIVILLTSEERGLLPADDPFYSDTYAISSLYAQLEDEALAAQERLELSHSAWQRLLATTRAVYAGVRHQKLHVPAYGSRLFDPDRFPFLEGRRPGVVVGEPLPVDDLSMLGVLRALLELKLPGELRRLSYKHLEVEQVGHVYESLLDHNAIAADEVVLAVIGKAGAEPEVALHELETEAIDGDDALVEYLTAQSGRTPTAIAKMLNADVSEGLRRGLLEVTNNDLELVQRLLPYANLLRLDLRGLPLVYLPGSVYVTETTRKRDSGTAYTTRELADEVAQYALEPLVYVPGPLENLDPATWVLKSSAEILDLNICDPAIGSGAIAVAACRYLAERLVEAWRTEGMIDDFAVSGVTADDPERLDVLVDARRRVAERCIYGVDRDPMAVEMAKLSLWLVTMAKDRPFTFLDHAIVAGDSLLGITSSRQLTNFHINPERGKALHNRFDATSQTIENALADVVERRERLELQPVQTIVDVRLKTEELEQIEERLSDLKLVADLVIGATLAVGTGSELDQRLAVSLVDVTQLLSAPSDELRTKLQKRAQSWLDVDLPGGQPERRPMHWALTFPEVMGRGGFDGFVGNPPFQAARKISTASGSGYRDYLVKAVANGRKGGADLVTYFFLKAASLCRVKGCLGFLATNTVAQGDSREIGLSYLCESGWSIYRAVRTRNWPGAAGVEVAQVWMTFASTQCSILDGHQTKTINSALVEPGRALGDPNRLVSNVDLSFQGSIVLGMGFTMSPKDAAEMIKRDSHCSEVLQPFLNGDDLNSSPTHSASRWIVNFGERNETESRKFSEPWDHVSQFVYPERRDKDGKKYPRMVNEWWKYWNPRRRLYEKTIQMDRVMAIVATSDLVLPVRVPTDQVFSHSLIVIASESNFLFGVLSSAFHQHWVFRYASTMRNAIRYTPTDVFETFPLPQMSQRVESAGELLDRRRSEFLKEGDIGLINLYRDLHHGVRSAELTELASMHIELDEAVASAYGWSDIDLDHGLHSTTQGVRFTIGEAARAEILDRLLELNHQRHAEEVAAGLGGKAGKAPKKAKGHKAAAGPTLFGDEED